MTPSPKANRQKGKKYERDLRDMFREYTGLGEGDIDSAVGSETGVDIKLSPAARKVLPLSVEAKARKTPDFKSWIKQAEANAYPDTIPAVFWRMPRMSVKDSLVILKTTDFLDLVDKYIPQSQTKENQHASL